MPEHVSTSTFAVARAQFGPTHLHAQIGSEWRVSTMPQRATAAAEEAGKEGGNIQNHLVFVKEPLYRTLVRMLILDRRDTESRRNGTRCG